MDQRPPPRSPDGVGPTGASTSPEHQLIVIVGDSARLQARLNAKGVNVFYPASRLASVAVPLDAMTEMVLTVMDKDVTARGLDLPSLREVARLR